MLACALLILTSPSPAQDDSTLYDFDIPPLPLSKAVQVFHLQTGLQVGYLPNSPEEEETPVGPVQGRYTASEALDRLLTPAKFSFQWVGSRVIDVIPPGDPRLAGGTGKATDEGVERRPPSAYGSRTIEIERVIVTAGRIRDLEESSAFGRTFSRRAIERSGAVTIADLFKLVSQQPFLQSAGFQPNGAQFAELRGLGPNMTLVLINGRRTLPSAANIKVDAFDLNTLPITAVDRIEILPDSASAMYGTDAIGGVVNIVLRRDVPHPTVDLHYGVADGGADERRASLSMGYRRNNANAALFADYVDTEPLLGAERDRWRNQDYRRFGGSDQRSIFSSPGNITSLLPGNLPGLPAPFAAVPRGTGSAPVTVSDFLATAGERNLESVARYVSFLPETRRLSVLGSGEIELTPLLLASGELMHVDRNSQVQTIPPALPGLPVPASNAFNPFRVPVVVTTLLTGMEPMRHNVESTMTRGVVGLRGQWSDWEWEAAALRTHEKAHIWIDGLLDFSRVMAALAQPDPNRALNVFQDGPAGSPELLASLLADPKIDRFVSKGTQVTAFASGPLPIQMPAGPVTLLAGGEWREEIAEFDTPLGSFGRTIAAGFAEIKVPLVSGSMQLPAVEELSLAVSGRHDDYSDFGSIFNPQYGLIWRINRDLTLRSSYGHSFRPASLHELFAPRISTPSQVMDPRRGELITVALTSGGNTELGPTRGESFTAGLELAPAEIPGLEFSASYWRVTVEDQISVLSPAAVLANEERLDSRVTRSDPTAADIAAGRPGVLTSVDTSRANLGQLVTSGIDVSAAYDVDTSLGRFTPSMSATWVDRFETANAPFLPTSDRINVANPSGTIVKWRVVPRLEWQRGIAEASLSARYTPAYHDTIGTTRTGRRVQSQTIVDIQASIDLSEYGDSGSIWQGFKVTAGASNLFDEYAPISEVFPAAGFDWSQGDLKGRFVYIRLGKKF